MRYLLSTALLFLPLIVQAEEFNLRDELTSCKFQLEIVIQELKTKLPFGVNQDLSYFRIRLAKHPRIVNRADELAWIKHDIDKIQEIQKKLYSYKDLESVESLFSDFNVLLIKYREILSHFEVFGSA